MFAQIDVPAYDFMDSDDEPRFKLVEFDTDEDDTEKGLRIVIGESVVTLSPIDDLARVILELTK